jgi:putative addiction module component (TIGR02574 family)
MRSQARKLLKAALKLPTRERATFAGSLLQSLDEKVDPDAEALWADEIARRVKDIDAGKVRLISWSDVRRRLYRQLPRSRHARR